MTTMAAPKDIYDSFAKILLMWHRENRRDFPWRNNPEPFGVLVAEFLLQRTPAKRVASFYRDFMSRYPTPCDLAIADEETLEREFTPLGLKKRAKWLLAASRVICDEYGGEVPEDYDELLRLPGVGEYTASTILCFGYGHDVAIVDVNVVRVLSRVFFLNSNLHRPKSLRIVKEAAEKLIPRGKGRAFNEALLDLAATVCKVKPLCRECPLNSFCGHFNRSK